MNSAVRTLPMDGGVALSRVTPFVLALSELRIATLLMLILISALASVYIKDWNRRLFIEDQKLITQQQNLENYQNKLILERGALSAPTRIQQIAENSLNMQLPDSSNVVMVKASDTNNEVAPKTLLFAEK